MFSLTGFLKGLLIQNEVDRSKQLIIQATSGATTGTSTTINAAQTANRTITLPDNSGTILTTGAPIPPSQLTPLTANEAVITDNSGFLTTSVTTATELSYVSGVTSSIQAQLNSAAINPMTTLGDTLYENATPAPARLPGNTTATKNFLTQTGTGSISAAPAWGTIQVADVPTLNQNTTGNAATATNIAGGSGGSLPYQSAANTTAMLANGTSGQILTSGGGTSAPSWQTQPATIPQGQCQLQSPNSSTITLVPFKGNLLFINGANNVIPAAGISEGISLSGNTIYYIYALMTLGVMSITASTSVPVVDSTYGIKVRTGNPAQTLVGVIRSNPSGNGFIDLPAQRFVRSWYNDPGVPVTNTFSTNRSTSSSSTVEINSEIRCELVTWAGETVNAAFNASLSNVTNTNNNATGLGINTGSTMSSEVDTIQVTANATQCHSGSYATNALTEGYNYFTLVGRSSNSSTITWSSVSRVTVSTAGI